MSKFGKLTKIATGVSAALLMSYGVTAQANIVPYSPSAYAESSMYVNNFQILGFDPTPITGGNFSLGPLVNTGPGSVITLNPKDTSVASKADVTLNGSNNAASDIIYPLDIAGPFSSTLTASRGVGYIPYTSYTIGPVPVPFSPTGPGLDAGTDLGAGVFAGGASYHIGNGLNFPSGDPNVDPSTTAYTQAQVNINGAAADGITNSRQILGSTVTLEINAGGAPETAGLFIDVLFDAETYLRSALGQPGVLTNVQRTWTVTVTKVGTFTPLLNFAPNANNLDDGNNDVTGLCKLVLGGCEVLFNPFDLNVISNNSSMVDFEEYNAPRTFGVRGFIPNGEYVISVIHDVKADAVTVAAVPEPGSLALLGLGLAGLGFARRKKQ